MNIKKIIESQYLASLDMLNQAIVKCPKALWNDPNIKNKFWHIAYHALFYTHLYLQPTEQDFTPWKYHRNEYQFMGAVPYPPHHNPTIDTPYNPEEILQYLEICQHQVCKITPHLDLHADHHPGSLR